MPLHVAGVGMTLKFLLGAFCGAVAILAAAALLRELLLKIYRAGYERGWKDAADWWTQAATDVKEMQKEIRYEEEQN